MEDKLARSPNDSQSRRSSSPRPSTSSPSPQPVITPRFSEGSISFLENLEIGELIGQGSYGKVYITLHPPDRKQYAIKKVQLDRLERTQYDLVKTEVANMMRVSHPGLLRLEKSLTWSSFIIMVMPLMAHTSCDQIIQRAYPTGLPEPAIGTIMKDVVNAVMYLHSKNIIHRTIKASHILIKESGAAVLSGFRHMMTMPHNQERMTAHNIMDEMGQFINWLSPEMLLQDSRGFGLNSDMYSIGITVCELGNGVVPYSDVSPSGILVKKLEEPPPKLWDKNFLPSQEPSGVTPPSFPDAPSGILRSSPDHPYQKKLYSQHIKKFVTLCVTPAETRLTSDQILKFKFYTIYSKESPTATLRNLPLLGPPLQYRATLEAAGQSSQASQASQAASSQEPEEWDLP